MMRTRCLTGLYAAVMLFLVLAASSIAEDQAGVHDDAIIFGQSAALKGPASALGLGMREGIIAAFHEANRSGGVHGRELRLISYNDGYEPEKAIENTIRLIEEDQVFALIGEVGTPTSKAVQPIATDRGIPFVGPFTGAAFLRNPSLLNVINLRASYNQETEAWIEYLADDLDLSRIAMLYQDDSFGRAGLAGVNAALEKRQLGLVAEGTYMRNTTAVKRALLAIRKADPEAVVIVGAYEPAAEFIKLAHSLGLEPIFMNISFVGSKALAQHLGKEGRGVLVTQVVPLPGDRTVRLVAEYQDALHATDPRAEFGFVSLEGYIVARLVIETLERIGPEVTRKGFLSTTRAIDELDLGGIVLRYGPEDNQGMDSVFLTEIQADGTFEAVDRFATQSR